MCLKGKPISSKSFVSFFAIIGKSVCSCFSICLRSCVSSLFLPIYFSFSSLCVPSNRSSDLFRLNLLVCSLDSERSLPGGFIEPDFCSSSILKEQHLLWQESCLFLLWKFSCLCSWLILAKPVCPVSNTSGNKGEYNCTPYYSSVHSSIKYYDGIERTHIDKSPKDSSCRASIAAARDRPQSFFPSCIITFKIYFPKGTFLSLRFLFYWKFCRGNRRRKNILPFMELPDHILNFQIHEKGNQGRRRI